MREREWRRSDVKGEMQQFYREGLGLEVMDPGLGGRNWDKLYEEIKKVRAFQFRLFRGSKNKSHASI